MALRQNKDHWYDGWVYDTLMAPALDGLFRRVVALAAPGSRVVDIGCGTGRLAFALAGKCGSVLGIDLSRRNIERAKALLARKKAGNVSFLHADAGAAFAGGGRFDYAVMTFILHEVAADERLSLISEAARVADKVIVGDYMVPAGGAFAGGITELVEFTAGRDHYRNYKNYVRGGGLRGLAAKAGLNIVSEAVDSYGVSHLALLSK